MVDQPAKKVSLLQVGRLTAGTEARLKEEFAVTCLWEQADKETFLSREGARFLAVVTSGGERVSADLIAALPALRMIGTRGVGYDHIDLVAVKDRGIAVSNTPGVLTDCVADLAFGALVAVARRLAAADRFVRRGDWLKSSYPLATRISGKRLGIVGFGRIGQAVAQRAGGFAMEVSYHSQGPSADAAAGYFASLLELAAWADFLVVSVPGGAATRHLISASVLEALGPEGYLVNVARGSVVDEEALVRALEQGKIAGAALDVFQCEPRVPAALFGMDNVVLLPHIASSTRETFAAMEELLLGNLSSFFATGKLLTPVSR